MSDYPTLAALEEAHDEMASAARRHLQDAEEHLWHYRSEVNRIQEGFHAHASQRGFSDHDEFRWVLQRVSDQTDESVREASRAIAELEEDLYLLLSRQDEERERFLRR